jgi:murein DD-endopeptidase MepM/ murein hydrolase activator NlpD
MNDGSTRMRGVRFSRQVIIIGASISVVFLLALTYGASRLLAGFMTRQAMSQVLDENQALQLQISGIEARLGDVNEQLTSLAATDDHLRLITDMPRIDKDVREVGVGGAATPASDYGLQDPKSRQAAVDLEKIEREIRLQKDSFAEIESRIGEHQELILHTPSIRPVEGGYISSGFGRRKDPFNGRSAFHMGVDISVERGTPVHSTADGRVVFAKASPGLGNLVIVDHGFGFISAYGHLSRILVSKGQTIERGQKIALTGNTGRSTAPHLHYEVHVNGDPVDPRDFFFDDNESLAALPIK